ncbi:hypothetical protein KAZ92_01165 [Candidatus Gracilibacteria bacterium]|nr:hypothetical protein [Candidatus Gracilibacteria bacterium]
MAHTQETEKRTEVLPFVDAGPLREGSSEYVTLHSKALEQMTASAAFGSDLTRSLELALSSVERIKAQVSEIKADIERGHCAVDEAKKKLASAQELSREAEEQKRLAQEVLKAHKEKIEQLQREQQVLRSSFFGKFRIFRKRQLQIEKNELSDKTPDFESVLQAKRVDARKKKGSVETAELDHASLSRRLESDTHLQPRLEERLSESEQNLAQIKEGKTDSYRMAYEDFLRVLDKHWHKPIFQRLLAKATEDPLLRVTLYGKDESMGMDSRAMMKSAERALKKGIPTDAFFRLLKIHEEDFLVEREAFLQSVEVIKEDFCAAAERAITEGWLPVDLERVKKRIKELKVDMIDALLYPDILGHAELWKVKITSDTSPEEYRDTLFHEFTHAAISGRNLRIGVYSNYFRIPIRPRSGLSIFTYDEHGNKVAMRHDEVTEAVTENTSLKLLGADVKDRGCYAIERAKYNKTVRGKLDLSKKIMELYCADTDPDSDENEVQMYDEVLMSFQY